MKKRLEFRYDHQSRRVEKKVLSGYSGGSYATTGTTVFAWSGWMLISEIAQTPTPPYSQTNSYLWGLDLSGSLSGAGGVGGLLSMTRSTASGTNTYFYCMDGNGNVMRLVDTAGATAAEYEYSPVGKVAQATESTVLATSGGNNFRFSTKQFDAETGAGYWGYRWYHPETGRWMSRDRIGEVGGKNLYGYVGNMPSGLADALGDRTFFVKRDTQPPTIEIHIFLRYVPCCEEMEDDKNGGKGSAYSPNDLEKRAKEHKDILEAIFAEGRDGKPYTYQMGGVTYQIQLFMHITATKLEDAVKRIKQPQKEQYLAEVGENKKFKTYQEYHSAYDKDLQAYIDQEAANRMESEAYSTIQVCKYQPSKPYNFGMIPGQFTYSSLNFKQVLLHELVGHGLNNYDEYEDTSGSGPNWKELYSQSHGGTAQHPVYPDTESIMNNAPSSFIVFDRHFKAGFEDERNNPLRESRTGKFGWKIEAGSDETTWISDAESRFWSGNSTKRRAEISALTQFIQAR